MDAPRRIVVGVDGSEGSDRALEWAVALMDDGEGSDAEIIAVHVLAEVSGIERDGPAFHQVSLAI
jgi:nucleotide-binding universal stress UspA family protein